MGGQVPDHSEEDGWSRGDGPSDGPWSAEFHYPESPEASPLWERTSPRRHAGEETRPDQAPSESARGADGSAPPAAERFRRTTRARARRIPDLPSRGPWGLAVGTVLFVMVIGSLGDHTEPVGRLSGHVLFWSLVSLGALARVYRERRNEWEPAARWPWPVAAVAGSVVAEVLALGVSSVIVITGSLILLGLGLFVLVLVE